MLKSRFVLFVILLVLFALFVPSVSAAPLFQEVPDHVAGLIDKLPPVSIGGIGLLGLVVGIVQLARKWFLPINFALPLAVVLVLASYGALIAVNLAPGIQDTVIRILELIGFVIGLLGGPKLLYHGAKAAGLPLFKKVSNKAS